MSMRKLFENVARATKPRTSGLTMVIDTGASATTLAPELEATAEFIDYVKLGWCTPLLSKEVSRKIELYRSHGIKVCTGGTLFELAFLKGEMDLFERYVEENGFDYIEVSDGTIAMDRTDKLRCIERLAARHTVISEYGNKEETELEAPSYWVEGMKEELNAGAWKVVAEGRESGTMGLYRPSAELRTGLVDELLNSIALDKIIWETPLKPQQVWFIRKFGADVNLGNIAQSSVIGLETLRVGLRSDTLLGVHADDAHA